jgi:hypothetical protein
VPYWKRYGPTIIGEQTVYKMQGQSHTSRHASVELRYAEQSGDTSRNPHQKALAEEGWNWQPLSSGGVLRLNRKGSNQVEIVM